MFKSKSRINDYNQSFIIKKTKNKLVILIIKPTLI